MVKKLLVLGHRGMLGNAVTSYFTKEGYTILTVETRWGDQAFKDELLNTEAEYIINCIGAIPQKKLGDDAYLSINVELPKFLETLGKKIIHPTTDCEFSGKLTPGNKYTKENKRDAEDLYGKSKAIIANLIESSFVNTKMIRVSIIGHELNTSVSFLDWFLHAEGTVNGYTNHYWNGITTLEWAKQCKRIIENWETTPLLSQFGTEDVLSKYEMLVLIQKNYTKEITISPAVPGETSNKSLTSDILIPSLKNQLKELKEFYAK